MFESLHDKEIKYHNHMCMNKAAKKLWWYICHMEFYNTCGFWPHTDWANSQRHVIIQKLCQNFKGHSTQDNARIWNNWHPWRARWSTRDVAESKTNHYILGVNVNTLKHDFGLKIRICVLFSLEHSRVELD